VHAIDIDFGTTLWKYHINYSASPPPVLTTTPACPGGLTAAVSRPTVVRQTSFASGGGRGGRSGGGVGEPGMGATTLPASARSAAAAIAPPPAAATTPPAGTVPGSAAAAAGAVPGGLPGGARAGGPGGGGGGNPAFVPGSDAAYVVGSDGYLHALNVSNGWDNMTPALFLPANTRAMGLIVATGEDGAAVAYTETTHGCGSQPDAVWALDLASAQKTVVAFKLEGATIAGTAGPALGRDGTVYVATTDGTAAMSNSIVALEARTLKRTSSATVAKADFSSSPLVLQWKDRDVVAVAGGGEIFVFDGASLQPGPIASASFGGANADAGSLASWTDDRGTRWIAAPSARGIETFRLVDQDGKAALQPGWTSRAIAGPLAPLVVNGVLFTASSGTRNAPAVLYAIDAATGKDLWNSGRTIASPVRGGLSAGGGNVYVPGADSTLYAFGFEIEK
jgi:hypothetical protein